MKCLMMFVFMIMFPTTTEKKILHMTMTTEKKILYMTIRYLMKKLHHMTTPRRTCSSTTQSSTRKMKRRNLLHHRWTPRLIISRAAQVHDVICATTTPSLLAFFVYDMSVNHMPSNLGKIK